MNLFNFTFFPTKNQLSCFVKKQDYDKEVTLFLYLIDLCLIYIILVFFMISKSCYISTLSRVENHHHNIILFVNPEWKV